MRYMMKLHNSRTQLFASLPALYKSIFAKVLIPAPSPIGLH